MLIDGKPKYREKNLLHCVTLSVSDPTWTDLGLTVLEPLKYYTGILTA
jgi:hypothetical protein